MAWTFRKPIHLTKDSSLDTVIDYIANPAKCVSKPIHDTPPLSSLEQVIDYATDRQKTGEGGKYFVSGFNCEAMTAETEMEKTLRKYGKWQPEERVAYHNIISFSRESGITHEELMDFGKEFCKRFYPNFQCVIACHINPTETKGGSQPHIHIITNAIDMNGKKLRDDMFQSPTSLTNMRKVCDELCLERGLEIIDSPNSNKLFGQKVNYIHSLIPSQTKTIEGLIDRWKPFSVDMDSLLENMQLETGCEIKKTGKNIAIRLPEQKRFRRLSTLSMGYTPKDLNKYFEQRLHARLVPQNVMEVFQRQADTEEGEELLQKAQVLVESVVQPQTRLEGGGYTKFEYARLKTKQELERLKALKQYMVENGIESKQDLMKVIAKTNTELVSLQKEHKDRMEEVTKDLTELNLCRAYLQTVNEPDSELHQKLVEKLGSDRDKVRQRLSELREKTSEAQRELFQLGQIQERAKANTELLKIAMEYTGQTHMDAISFTAKHIVSQNGLFTVIEPPYMKGKRVTLNTGQITNDKYGRFLYYVAPDEPLTLVSGKTETPMTGEALCSAIDKAKEGIQERRRQDGNCTYSVSENCIEVVLDPEMVDSELSDSTVIHIRVPNTNYYADIPANKYDPYTHTLSLDSESREWLTCSNDSKTWKLKESTLVENIEAKTQRQEREEVEEHVWRPEL